MEEMIEDIFEVIVPSVKYCVKFDRDSKKILEVFPSSNDNPKEHIVYVDSSIAESILKGFKPVSNFLIDINLNEYKIVESVKSGLNLSKIDDILHRVVEKKWSNIKDPDILITYNRKVEEIVFKINPKIKNLDWSGPKEMLFFITSYNDPNSLKEMIKINLDDLKIYPHKYKIKLRTKFSVFTRRLLTHYALEIK